MNPVTTEQVKEEAQEYREGALAELAQARDVPEHIRNDPRLKEATVSGAWLNHRLEDLGLDEDTVRSIGMAHGQYSVFRDPYKWAAQLYNDALEGKYAKGGRELADEINEAHLKFHKTEPPDMERMVAEVDAAIDAVVAFVKQPVHKDLPHFEPYYASANGWKMHLVKGTDGKAPQGACQKDNLIIKMKPEQAERALLKAQL